MTRVSGFPRQGRWCDTGRLPLENGGNPAERRGLPFTSLAFPLRTEWR